MLKDSRVDDWRSGLHTLRLCVENEVSPALPPFGDRVAGAILAGCLGDMTGTAKDLQAGGRVGVLIGEVRKRFDVVHFLALAIAPGAPVLSAGKHPAAHGLPAPSVKFEVIPRHLQHLEPNGGRAAFIAR